MIGSESNNESPLAAPVTQLAGVGPERAALLARLGVGTIHDILRLKPRRYEDRRRVQSIAQLRAGVPATIRGKVVSQGVKYFQRRTRSVYEMVLEDGTVRLYCRWWQMPYMQDRFSVGEELWVHGKTKSLKPRTFDHPEVEMAEPGEDVTPHINRIVPVYPLTEGLSGRWLRGLVWRVLSGFAAQLEEEWPWLERPGFPGLREAIQQLHFPDELARAELARQRLAVDEFIQLQLQLQRRRRNLEAGAKALPCSGDNRLIRPLLRNLGFQLTEAQTRVLRELRRDMGGACPMRRLLQGDVGSGKTVVAACCALMAIENGFDVALMAPTEILAFQHYQTFRRWIEPLGVSVRLCTGSQKTVGAKRSSGEMELGLDRPRREPVAAPPEATHLPTGEMAIGTHALLEDGFAVDRLGLVIIDEQHKFGVAQRERLVRKGAYPHLLIMTATPIPRSLGLTLYGDMDVSVIDALPPGRGHVRTFVRTPAQLPKVWEFVRQQLGEGRQAYVVYPRLEEADSQAGIKALTQEFEKVRTTLSPFNAGLIHGRMKPEEKDRAMTAFRANQCQVLMATSIIEVGLDVPNATIMVIENAEQFGLAQLHQLRGRVGRGPHPSYCILVGQMKTPEAEVRLRTLERTENGFEVAQADLQMRGPGELLGREQSGMPAFIFGDLARDLPLIEKARGLAAQILDREG